MYREIYYEELAHTVMEADKFQDLQVESASWGPRRASGLVPKTSRFKPQEEPVFQFESDGRKNLCPSSEAVRQEEFSLTWGRVSLFVVFRSSADWGGLPTLTRAICFTYTTILNVYLIQKHPHRNTQNNVWPNTWAPHGPVKLTHKINHQKSIVCQLHLLKFVIQFDWCPYKEKKFGHTKKDTRDACGQRKDYVSTQQEDDHLQARERGLRRSQSCWHLDLGLPASRTVRNVCGL